MFGYIKIHKSEMKFKEYELYKGLYCSLCKQLGKDYGFVGRMTLNYDFTFFLLCRYAISDKKICFNSSSCSFNKRKKCVCCDLDEDEIRYTASLSIILTYFKIRDNLCDEKLLKKLPMLLILPIYKLKFKKAKLIFPDVTDYIEKQLKMQDETEKKNNLSIDEYADSSAKIMGYAFSYNAEKDKEKLNSFGYSVGRLIYFLDAVDDYEKDKKESKFNPFLANRKYDDDLKSNMRRILNNTADENAKIYDMLRIKKFKSIIDNIIYYGFDDCIEQILKNKENKNECL